MISQTANQISDI